MENHEVKIEETNNLEIATDSITGTALKTLMVGRDLNSKIVKDENIEVKSDSFEHDANEKNVEISRDLFNYNNSNYNINYDDFQLTNEELNLKPDTSGCEAG